MFSSLCRRNHVLRVRPLLFSSSTSFCSDVRSSPKTAQYHYNKGQEYFHKNELGFAIREFNRARLAFESCQETSPTERIIQADNHVKLAEALILSSDRKMLASGLETKRFTFSNNTYSQALSHFLKALNLYPKTHEFLEQRALCWQRAG